MLMGLIAEACKESMIKNMDEAMKIACAGIIDENIRVRYAGLSCLALVLTELSPKAQKKYHGELMPVLMKMMIEESLLKVQTHTISTIINFAKGLES
jgi:ABC-type xylose transport system permease subunit